MNKRLLSILLILIGALVMIVNHPLKPFDSGFEGPIVILFEFAGPLVFTLGVMIFGYQLVHYYKEREWPDEVSKNYLLITIAIGLLASTALFIYRLM